LPAPATVLQAAMEMVAAAAAMMTTSLRIE